MLFRPFPQIARYITPSLPEDQIAPYGVFVENEPVLPGMPIGPKDSAFSDQLGLCPHAPQILEDVDAFLMAENGDKQETVLRRVTRRLLSEPRLLGSYLDGLSKLDSDVQPRFISPKNEGDPNATVQGERSVFAWYRGLFEAKLEHNAATVKNISVENLGTLAELITIDPLHRETAARALKGLYTGAERERRAIEFIYDFATGIMASPNSDVQRVGYAILSFSMPIFPSGSDGHRRLMFAALRVDNDERLRKNMEFEAALFHLSLKFGPEFRDDYIKRCLDLIRDDRGWLAAQRENHLKDPAKYEALTRYHARPSGAIFFNPGESRPWPESVALVSGPLRCAINRQNATDIEGVYAVWVPGAGVQGWHGTHEQIVPRVVKQFKDLAAGLTDRGRFDDPDPVANVFLLRPELTRDKLLDMAAKAKEVGLEILTTRKTFLSARGDEIRLRDKSLRDLGLESITFYRGEDGLSTLVDIGAAGCKFGCQLDSYYNLRSRSGGTLPLTQQQSSFLQLVILYHLRDLICLDRASIVRVEGHRQESDDRTGRKFYGRRATMPRLREGAHFTAEAVKLAWKDCQFDLVGHNERLRALGLREVTYAGPVDPPGEEQPSTLKLVAPHAMEEMRLWLDNSE